MYFAMYWYFSVWKSHGLFQPILMKRSSTNFLSQFVFIEAFTNGASWNIKAIKATNMNTLKSNFCFSILFQQCKLLFGHYVSHRSSGYKHRHIVCLSISSSITLNNMNYNELNHILLGYHVAYKACDFFSVFSLDND